MAKYCIVNKLKKENVEDYCRLHRNCWPEMREAIKESGALECMVFVLDDLSIFIFESEDIEKSFTILGVNEVNKKWQEKVSPWFADGNGFELNMAEKVFDLFE